MFLPFILSSYLFSLQVMASPDFFGHHGRRVCSHDHRHGSVVQAIETYVQPVHKPYITQCQDHRLCSTYKTVYRVSYRQVSKAASPSHYYPECCPGWRRLYSHHCNQAVCVQACVNGGTCSRPNSCVCPPGWTGHQCQTDVDECTERRPCSQECVNSAGSYRCGCREGYALAGDGRSCLSPTPPPPHAKDLPASSNGAGAGVEMTQNVTEEVQSLKNRVELLEQKLQLVLAPLNSLYPHPLDEGLPERTTFLSHSLQQLDRIDSLSEQIGFLEERLGTCSCQGT